MAIYRERGSSAVPNDDVKAFAKGNLAAAHGHNTAAKSYDRLATRMTAEYIT